MHNIVTKVVRAIHRRLFIPPHCPDLVSGILERMIKKNGQVQLIQIGAHAGNTDNDPLIGFMQRYARSVNGHPPQCRAVVVEPVLSLFLRLTETYKDCDGVVPENCAIAEESGERNFYRLKDGTLQNNRQLPGWLDQLGSLRPERTDVLWDRYERDPALKAVIAANQIVERIPCLTFADLMKKHSLTNVDFLQIDTEGYDGVIVNSIDFNQYKPAYINFERVLLFADEPQCRMLLTRHGYRLFDHGQDTLASQSPPVTIARRLAQTAYCNWLKLVNLKTV